MTKTNHMGKLKVLLKYVAFRKRLWIDLICLFQQILFKKENHAIRMQHHTRGT